MALSTGLFKGIASAQSTTSSRYFHPGSFVTQLVKVVDRTGAKATRNSGNAVIFEQRVIAVLDNGGDASPLRPGQTVAHMISDGGARKDMFLGNVKASLGQIAQAMDPSCVPDSLGEDEWLQLLDAAIGEQQIMAGTFLGVVCTPIATKANKPFTRTNYQRGYSARELRDVLKAIGQPEDVLFPGGALQALIDAELKAAAAPAAVAAA